MAVSLVELLRQSVRRHPERAAVSQPGGPRLTYRELDAASARIAGAVAVGRGDRVGLLLPKSVAAVAGLWGVMRAGAAYVPIDPTAPPQRAAFIAGNCAMSAVLVSSELAEAVDAVRAALPGVPLIQIHGSEALAGPSVIHLDPFAAGPPPKPFGQSPANVRDLAYILYTSGSTGTPKGVMVSHGAALAFIDWAVATFEVEAADVLSSHAPFHFDLSTFDLFAAAATGAEVVILDEETVRFPVRSADALVSERISVWYSVPGALRRMLRNGGLGGRDLSALRVVLFAGEPYPADDLRRLQAALPASIRLANLYGPTETNVCTFWEVPPAGQWDYAQVPIGIDCSSCQGIVVDDGMRPVADGVPGELLIRGGTLMIGYWGDPDRTAKSFLPDFAYPHLADLLYRTGDIVRRMPDGLYEFHGRRDSMVKVRGYRIELGEIEVALLQAEGVTEAAVVAVQRRNPEGEQDTQLLAFVALAAPSDLHDESRRLHAHLARTLPKHMIPSEFRWVTRLPSTSSGKIDRQSLMRLGSEPPAHAG